MDIPPPYRKTKQNLWTVPIYVLDPSPENPRDEVAVSEWAREAEKFCSKDLVTRVAPSAVILWSCTHDPCRLSREPWNFVGLDFCLAGKELAAGFERLDRENGLIQRLGLRHLRFYYNDSHAERPEYLEQEKLDILAGFEREAQKAPLPYLASLKAIHLAFHVNLQTDPKEFWNFDSKLGQHSWLLERMSLLSSTGFILRSVEQWEGQSPVERYHLDQPYCIDVRAPATALQAAFIKLETKEKQETEGLRRYNEALEKAPPAELAIEVSGDSKLLKNFDEKMMKFGLAVKSELRRLSSAEGSFRYGENFSSFDVLNMRLIFDQACSIWFGISHNSNISLDTDPNLDSVEWVPPDLLLEFKISGPHPFQFKIRNLVDIVEFQETYQRYKDNVLQD